MANTLMALMTLAPMLFFPQNITFASESAPPPGCLQRQALQHVLENLGETKTYIAVTRNAHVLEIYTSEDGRTWTIVLVQANGCAGIAADGEFWSIAPTIGEDS